MEDKKYKMRWYQIGGENDGNCVIETFHDSLEQMQDIQLSMHKIGIEFIYRPTMWEKFPQGWKKMNDYV